MRNPYFSLLATCWKYARNERGKFLLIYAMLITANVIFSLNPLLFGWFIGKVQNDSSKVMHYTLIYALCYIGLKFAEWCFHGPARVMERTLAFNLSRHFLQEKYHQVLHLPSNWHQDHHSGATINRVGKAYGALRDFFDRGFTFVYTISKFVFSVAAILYFSPLFGSIAIVLGTLNIWIISRYNKPFIKTLKEVNEREHKVTATLFDTLSNIRTVITLRLENSMEKGLMRKVRLVFRPFRKNALINEWKWFTGEMLITVIYGVVVMGFVYQHWEPGKVFYIAGLVTLLGYVNQFTSVFQNVAGQYTDILQYNTNINAAASISEAYENQHRPEKPALLPENWRNMEISRLNFTYPGAIDQKYIPQSLHNLHMNIERGKKIALIGESGSGKSTLLSVLRGLYTTGKDAEFLVDGKKYLLDSLNESVTLFPQEPEIFENTISYNITLGLPFSEQDIMRVCEEAQFADVINQMPDGLLTEIREKGVNLSGGQKQRLALARGILAARNSHMILLDEPTSSLDPRTEARIYQKLFKSFSDKAIISSIHRLHLLDQFDYIYILDKGRVVDEGSFEKLINESDIFRAMWNHQQAQAVEHIKVA
jgi:ATP-binding cassette, subfamily B, bacterial